MTTAYDGYQRLRFDRPHPRVLRITMDNGRMNTADAAMHAELVRVWRDVDADDSVNCAIITGAGKTFSAGGDFGMVREIMESFEARTRAWREARDIVYNLVNCRKPVVVPCAAWLWVRALSAHPRRLSIATRDCRITDGHTRLGWRPATTPPWSGRALRHGQGEYYLLTATCCRARKRSASD